MTNYRDILIFMSDQHSANVSGFMGNKTVRTPNLDRIASGGTVCDYAYTPCPLCVPARMAALCGMLPTNTGVVTNYRSLPEEVPTFAHSFAAIGYETVLCGRMHFMGEDQKHGFMKRIGLELTPYYSGYGHLFKRDMGDFWGTFSELRSIEVIGGGKSPVLEYDKMVIQTALEYLAQPHEKPQLIVVGTYAPHFPYVCPPELFDYYRPIVQPPSVRPSDISHSLAPYSHRFKKAAVETYLNARAAYYGMVENMDAKIGAVHKAFRDFSANRGRDGLFIYCSDHGDMLGEYDMVGKQTLMDNAVQVPMVFEGDGIPKGNRVNAPVSLLDLYPTLCSMYGAPVHSYLDGSDISAILHGEKSDKHVITEIFIEKGEKEKVTVTENNDKERNDKVLGRMVIKDGYKYVVFPKLNVYQLFKIGDDTREISSQHPEICARMRAILEPLCGEEELIRETDKFDRFLVVHNQCAKNVPFEETYRWIPPPECTKAPGSLPAL